MNSSGRILVVDDNRTIRLKLKKAVEALGHSCVAVENGKSALAYVRNNPIDVMLLDIVMPDVDGFQVLEALKGNAATADIPVIVISYLDGEMSSVVRAIELGAEDFLPRDFEPVLLRARINAAVAKKRYRDQEVDYLKQVARLTDAASVLEQGNFNPSRLGLKEISVRTDALGLLARVFATMAQEVYERERRLRRNVRTLKGGLLLLACGLFWGLLAPLSKMAANIEAHPIGLALTVDALGAVICVSIALYQRKLPHLTKGNIGFFLIWAVLYSVVNQVLVYWLTSKLTATFVSVLIVLEGFAVFLFAALMKIEAPSLRRFAGLGLGFAGVLGMFAMTEVPGGSNYWVWMLLSLLVPLTYAVEDLYIAARKPKDVDSIAAIGTVMAISFLLLLPMAYAFDDFMPLSWPIGRLQQIAAAMTFATLIANILFIYLIVSTGAVFASQTAYAVTISGIAWSIALLGEQLSVWLIAALALIVLGLILVEPKQEAEEEPPLPVLPQPSQD